MISLSRSAVSETQESSDEEKTLRKWLARFIVSGRSKVMPKLKQLSYRFLPETLID